jgi:hypothetical protein
MAEPQATAAGGTAALGAAAPGGAAAPTLPDAAVCAILAHLSPRGTAGLRGASRQWADDVSRCLAALSVELPRAPVCGARGCARGGALRAAAVDAAVARVAAGFGGVAALRLRACGGAPRRGPGAPVSLERLAALPRCARRPPPGRGSPLPAPPCLPPSRTHPRRRAVLRPAGSRRWRSSGGPRARSPAAATAGAARAPGPARTRAARPTRPAALRARRSAPRPRAAAAPRLGRGSARLGPRPGGSCSHAGAQAPWRRHQAARAAAAAVRPRPRQQQRRPRRAPARSSAAACPPSRASLRCSCWAAARMRRAPRPALWARAGNPPRPGPGPAAARPWPRSWPSCRGCRCATWTPTSWRRSPARPGRRAQTWQWCAGRGLEGRGAGRRVGDPT